MDPRVSTAGNFLTIAFFLAILPTPMARIIVTTVASPSGIAATAKAMAVLKASSKYVSDVPFVVNISKKKTTTHIIIDMIPITLPTCDNFCCKGVV